LWVKRVVGSGIGNKPGEDRIAARVFVAADGVEELVEGLPV
jgi:hypothetical protein